MTSKTILVGLVAMAFVTGTIMVNPFAEAAGGWKEALDNLTIDWSQITGIPDDITTSGDYQYAIAKSRTLTICGYNAVPILDTEITYLKNCRLQLVDPSQPLTGPAVAVFPVNGLPHGATITGFSCNIREIHSTADATFTCTLNRESPSLGVAKVATAQATSSGTIGLDTISAPIIDLPVVDQNFGYYIQYELDGDGITACGGACMFHLAKITYEVTQAD